MSRNIILLSIAVILMGLHSCRSINEVAYFQPKDSITNNKKATNKNFEIDSMKLKVPIFEAVIQSNDILSIYVSSLSPEASSFFNTISSTEKQNSSTNNSTKPNVGYLVNVEGMIEMPLIGKVKVGGLTTRIAHDTIVSRLEQFLQNPSVRINIENFRVTILGEVKVPGLYTINNEKLNISEALGLAGDLTIYGDRKEVLLIREENGNKTYNYIDLTRRDIFHSPLYNLHSNDVLYIKPVRGRVSQSDNAVILAPLLISTMTLVIVLLDSNVFK
jgi:polysaccharide biosynthesis/export protein